MLHGKINQSVLLKKRFLVLFLCAAWFVMLFAGCGTDAAETDAAEDAEETEAAEEESSNADEDGTAAESLSEVAVSLTDAVTISLSDAGTEISGSGASVEENVITITAGGTYICSGTLSDGRIVVDAADETVILVLDGAEINCSYSSPVFIYKAELAVIQLQEGTENSLSDGTEYDYEDVWSSKEDEEPNACLYSKADLVLQGSGSLTVNANFDNGVTGKDNLAIYNVTLTVFAEDNGINGKDSCTVEDAVITVECGGDALRSTNDSDETLGWISAVSTVLNLTAGEDGIQAETDLTLTDVTCTLSSGGGSTVEPTDATSTKGIKAGSSITISGGSYVLDCSDDAVHTNGDLLISGGEFTVSSQDDGFHADDDMTITDGTFEILTCYEGLESSTMTISGGTFYITASDDGLNAAGGTDGSGFGGFGSMNMFTGFSSSYSIDITGGYLVILAGGDGLDSNGSITMTGGTVLVASSGTDDGALDSETGFTLDGGTLLAVNGSSMWITTPTATQNTVSVTFDSTLSAGTLIALENDTQSFVFELPINAVNILFSSPELETGGTYTVSTGGSYSGELTDWIGTDGTYTDGTVLTELTLSDTVTSYGSTGGMSGGRGGMMDVGSSRGGSRDGDRDDSSGDSAEDDAAPSGEGAEPGEGTERGDDDVPADHGGGSDKNGDAPADDGSGSDRGGSGGDNPAEQNGGETGGTPDGGTPSGNAPDSGSTSESDSSTAA